MSKYFSKVYICFLTWSWLKKHYHIMEEKKRCCYFKCKAHVLIGQSTENIILFLNVIFLFTYIQHLRWLLLKKSTAILFFLLLLFSFFNLSQLSCRSTPIFSIEKTVNFQLCGINPYKIVFFPLLLKINQLNYSNGKGKKWKPFSP